MKGILVLIFSVFFYPLFTAQDDSQAQNKVICDIAGSIWESTYVFNITDLPERCDIISVAQYAFDRDDGPPVLESDKGIMTTLIKANRTVYTRIGFVYDDNWAYIFDPEDTEEFQKDILDPLIDFINTTQVNAIIINSEDLYNVPVVDLTEKLCNFVSKLKNNTDNVLIGLIVSGSYYDFFPNISLLDFSISNEVLDLYIIDLSNLNNCDNVTVLCGQSPITSNNTDLVTIEQVISGVNNSSMDKSKIYAMLQMYPFIPLDLLPEDAGYRITTYSIYCSSTDSKNSSQWCKNPSKLSYDQGAYAKEFFVGIVLEQLDTDDYENACGCEKFPVSNQYIDGYTGSPFKSCPKLDLK